MEGPRANCNLYLYSHGSCALQLSEQGWFPQLLAAEKSIAAWPPGCSQPLQDLSWCQDLSPTFHSRSSCKRAPASSTFYPILFFFFFFFLWSWLWVLLQDSKALHWANIKPGLFSSGLFSSPVSSGPLKPQGPLFSLQPGQRAIRNLYWKYPHGLQGTGPPP